MLPYTVVFAPEADDQLQDLYLYVADQASSETADRFTEAILETCHKLALFPHRGVSREDIRPGLRVTHHQGRTIIAYWIDEQMRQVVIVGIYHGGQHYDAALTTNRGN